MNVKQLINVDHVKKIHDHLFPDAIAKNGKYSNWAYMLEEAIRTKNYRYLITVLAFGKGWNDKSKEVFCDIIGVTRQYLQREMRECISLHCDISLELIDLHFDYISAKKSCETAKESLIEAFSNGIELVEIVDCKINDGFIVTQKYGRRTYLVNEESKKGWPLQRVPIKNYAIAKTALLALEFKRQAIEEHSL